MALISCPECGQMVSDKAKTCIHCGAPLGKPEYTVRIKTPAEMVNLTYTFTDDSDGRVLATANRENRIVSFKLDKPTTIRCHLGRGYKDGLLEYVPHENARYVLTRHDHMFKYFLAFEEVDVIDSE